MIKINSITRLLVISPHPDDEALGVGGLIGKCLKNKAKVFILYFSIGTSRQHITGQTNASTRLTEIKNLEKFARLKTKIVYQKDEFCRLDTLPQKDLIEIIEDTITEQRPDIIALPSSSSYNQDHRAVFSAAITALRPLPKKLSHFVPTVLEYYEPYFWTLNSQPKPNLFLNLEEKFQKGNLLDFKLNLYRCHATQVRENPFARSPENLTHLAHIYGKEIGVNIAEAYHLHREEIC